MLNPFFLDFVAVWLITVNKIGQPWLYWYMKVELFYTTLRIKSLNFNKSMKNWWSQILMNPQFVVFLVLLKVISIVCIIWAESLNRSETFWPVSITSFTSYVPKNCYYSLKLWIFLKQSITRNYVNDYFRFLYLSCDNDGFLFL